MYNSHSAQSLNTEYELINRTFSHNNARDVLLLILHFPHMYGFIDESFKSSEEFLMQYLKYNGYNLWWIEEKHQTRNICIYAITHNPESIATVKKQTVELCLLAFNRGLKTFASINIRDPLLTVPLIKLNPSYYSSLTPEEKTFDVSLCAAHSGVSYNDIPVQFRKDKEMLIALAKSPNSNLGYVVTCIMPKCSSRTMKELLLKNNRLVLDHVPHTSRNIMIVMRNHNPAYVLHTIPHKLHTESMVLNAIRLTDSVYSVLANTPIRTRAVCKSAVIRDWRAIGYVPQTYLLCYIALRRNYRAYELIKHKTRAMEKIYYDQIKGMDTIVESSYRCLPSLSDAYNRITTNVAKHNHKFLIRAVYVDELKKDTYVAIKVGCPILYEMYDVFKLKYMKRDYNTIQVLKNPEFYYIKFRLDEFAGLKGIEKKLISKYNLNNDIIQLIGSYL